MQLPSQFKRKQTGFIQNFIIPGIILIGVVIAGIAMLASNSGGTDTSNEKASMIANTVIGQGLSMSGAVQRAMADGAFQEGFNSNYFSYSGVGGGGYTQQDTLDSSLGKILVGGKYLTAWPTAPQDLQAHLNLGDGGWRIGVDNGYYTDSNADTHIPGKPYLDITLGLIDENAPDAKGDALLTAVCQRINNKLNGTPSQAAVPAVGNDIIKPAEWTSGEGCAVQSGGYVKYFKLL